jgi:hypothetical protein
VGARIDLAFEQFRCGRHGDRPDLLAQLFLGAGRVELDLLPRRIDSALARAFSSSSSPLSAAARP